MIPRIGLLSALALSLAASAAAQVPAASPPGDCAVLDQLVRDARTDFPALKDKGFGGARCIYRGREFKCLFPFGTDLYGQAETQRDRLVRCTIAQPHARLLEKKEHEALFQLNPETKMDIRGPDPDNGHWTIQLKITTTAEWNRLPPETFE